MRTVSVLVLGLALAGAPGCHVHYQFSSGSGGVTTGELVDIGAVEEGLPIEGATKLDIQNNVGAIVVTAVDGSAVSFVAHVKVPAGKVDRLKPAALARDIRVSRSKGALVLRNAHMDDSDANEWQIEWEVRAPKELAVSLLDGVGDETVSGMRGPVDMETGVGDLHGRLLSLARRFRAGTGNIDVATSSAEGAIDARSGVGDVSLVVAQAPAADITARSGTGNVAVRVPASFDGALDLATGVGNLDVKGISQEPDRSVVGATLRTSLGKPSPTITAASGVGDVRFTRGGAESF